MTRSPLFRFVASAAVTLALIGLWQLGADAGLISPVFFPGPDRSFGTLWEQLHDAEFWAAFAETLRRMALGFVSASVVGIAVGAVIGLSENVRAYVEPTLELIRPLPASAVIPVFVLMIGLNEQMIIAVIAFASLWPVLLGTVHGFKTIEPRLIEVSRMLHLSPLELVFKIALPNAMPDIFAGLRLALTVSLILAVVTEMLSGMEGLGHNIIMAARSFRSADLYAGIIVLGVIGYITNIALERLERYVLRWRRSGTSSA
jgi:ABC-type nitrate/sulfonate/bicarbonate transport system permease component